MILDLFGSKRALVKTSDDYIVESVRSSKSQALQSSSPITWFAQLAAIDAYVPTMAYLIRSIQHDGPLGRALMNQLSSRMRTGTPGRSPSVDGGPESPLRQAF